VRCGGSLAELRSGRWILGPRGQSRGVDGRCSGGTIPADFTAGLITRRCVVQAIAPKKTGKGVWNRLPVSRCAAFSTGLHGCTLHVFPAILKTLSDSVPSLGRLILVGSTAL
jgi:hypothetical protein